MKKLNFLMTALAMAAAVTLTSCDAENPDDNKDNGKTPIDNPGDDPTTGVPADGTRLVDKIVDTYEYSNEVETYTYDFSYDSKGRVTKIDVVEEEDDDRYEHLYTISYGATAVSVSYEGSRTVTEDDIGEPDEQTRAATAARRGKLADRHNLHHRIARAAATRASSTRVEPQVGDVVKTVLTQSYNLNSDGYIISIGAVTEKHWLNGTPWQPEDNSTYEESYTLSYKNGYIDTGTYNYREEGYQNDGVKRLLTGNSTYSYTWTGGNLTSEEINRRHTNQNGDEEPYEGTSNQVTTFQYTSKANPKSNIDFNMFVYELTDSFFLDALGFGGKRSANLTSGYNTVSDNNSNYSRTVTWENDANGYVTKYMDSYSHSYKDTYIVTYKN